MKFDTDGRELPDPKPIEIPIGMKQPESLQSLMARMIRTHLSHAAEKGGAETFEEANDFDIPEDDAELRATNYEYMGEEVPRGYETATDRDHAAPSRGASSGTRKSGNGEDSGADDDGGEGDPDGDAGSSEGTASGVRGSDVRGAPVGGKGSASSGQPGRTAGRPRAQGPGPVPGPGRTLEDVVPASPRARGRVK